MEYPNSQGGDQGENSSGRGKKLYRRHSPVTKQRLDTYFKECPHPNENQRRELAEELGLAPKQLKFWFQNKRNQEKTHSERAVNKSLREENERIQRENNSIKEFLNKALCPTCEGSPNAGLRKAKISQDLKLENAKLKEKYEKMVAFFAEHLPKPSLEAESVALPQNLLTNEAEGSIDYDRTLRNRANLTNLSMEIEKTNMIETARRAISDLVRLFAVNEPLWIKSPITQNYVIDYQKCDTLLLQPTHLPGAHLESSKEFALIPMNAVQLVDMFLDAKKYETHFPTIINEARTLYVLDSGLQGSHDGCKQLMYQKMHSLSPVVKPREFYFLRCSQELSQGIWIVGNVSYNVSDSSMSHHVSWRRPSGCMIQQTQNGFSKVSWIEQVEVDNGQIDLVSNGLAYGAERWVATLKRMCERINVEQKNNTIANGVGEGSKGVMQLSHRMVKEFCSLLCMSRSSNSLHLSGISDGEVQAKFRVSTGEGLSGMVVSVVTSFRLPIPADNIFDVLSDETKRIQWDVLSNGYQARRVARILSGNDPRNSISVLQSLAVTDNNMNILQETCVEALQSFIIYAPIDYSVFKTSVRGNPMIAKIYPSGFIITPYSYCPEFIESASTGRDTPRPNASQVTMALQILTACPSLSPSLGELNEETISAIKNLVSSTVQKIRVVFNCAD